jgi:transcriptional regulator with XRE-family HTH domain
MVADPLASRRRLIAELKRFRASTGENQRQVADALEWSPSKIHRIERGDVSVSVSDLKALLQHYDVHDVDVVASLVSMARGARVRQSAFSEFRDVFPPEIIRFFAYERTASRIYEVELLVVPGLLQTPAYTRALLESHGLDEARIDRFVQSREARQQLFASERPPRTSFIIDEAVLSRAIGGAEVMEEQLDRLLRANSSPDVSIHVLPLALGAHPGLRGPFVLLQFPEPQDPDVVYIEHRRGDSIFWDEAEVIEAHREVIHVLERLAAPPAALEKYVTRALDRLNSA